MEQEGCLGGAEDYKRAGGGMREDGGGGLCVMVYMHKNTTVLLLCMLPKIINKNKATMFSDNGKTKNKCYRTRALFVNYIAGTDLVCMKYKEFAYFENRKQTNQLEQG